MDIRKEVIDIIADITGTEAVRTDPEIRLFDEKILDSIGTVEMLVDFDEKLGVKVPISEFDRDKWATPNMIVERVEEFSA